jgi:hypothetical protein
VFFEQINQIERIKTMLNTVDDPHKQPLKKGKPAVYMPDNPETAKLIQDQEPEVRQILEEGLVSLAELASIVQLMTPSALFFAFNKLMSVGPWKKSVICKITVGEPQSKLGIMVNNRLTPSDITDDVFVPACWSDSVLRIASKGFLSVGIEEGKYFASKHVYVKGVTPAGTEARYLHLLSHPCRFDVTTLQYVEKKAA